MIGASSSNMAVMKDAKPPTVVPPVRLCHNATTTTPEMAKAVNVCVTGVIKADAATDFITSRRSRFPLLEETLGLVLRRVVQPHDAPGQHVLFDHVGQLVSGLLAGQSDAPHAPADQAHRSGHQRKHHADEQRELPVQPDQVAQQRHQRQAFAQHGQQRADQKMGALVHLVDHDVGQLAGRVPREQVGVRAQHPVEHGLAQVEHAFVGSPRQRVLGSEGGGAAHQEQPHDHHRHQPQWDAAVAEAAVKQRLHQRWQHRLGGRGNQ